MDEIIEYEKMPIDLSFDELSVALSYAILATGVAPAAAEKNVKAAKPVAKATANAEDFDDMFGDEPETKPAESAVEIPSVYGEDDENATEEEKIATKARQERMALAAKLKADKDAKEGKKAKVKEVEKSLMVLEVKPWEADTDLKMVWNKIVEYKQDGLTWGQAFELKPVAYGIMKLVFQVTIEDAKVLQDDITDAIEVLDEWVQSVNVVSMTKV